MAPVGSAVTRVVDAAGELRAAQDAMRGDLTVDIALSDATGAVERITRDLEGPGGFRHHLTYDAAGRPKTQAISPVEADAC